MASLILDTSHPGVINDSFITAEAASDLTGYNIQHVRRLAFSGRLEAIHVGRAWLIKVESLDAYLREVVGEGDGRFGPRTTPSKPSGLDSPRA